MSAFMLLIWISLIVILNVRGDVSLNENLSDKMNLCQHCNSQNLPDCSALESSNHNLTIHCSQVEQAPCVIAVVFGSSENNESDYTCFLSELIDIAENTIEVKKLENLLDNPDSAMSTDLPMENALVEEITIENAATLAHNETETHMETADIESTREETVTEATTTATTMNDNKNSQEIMEKSDSEPIAVDGADEILQAGKQTQVESDKDGEMPQADQPTQAESETSSVDNTDEMPQADQPLSEDETNNEQPTDIVDNKLEAKAPVDEMPAEQPETTEAQIDDAEPRMNTIENKVDGETKMQFLNCYGCQSTTNPNCITKPTQTVSCKTSEIGTNGCYTLLKASIVLCPHTDTHIERGCLNELAKHQWDQCLNINDTSCQICFESLCNIGTFPAERLHCHQCADTAECALEQEAKNALPCSRYEEKDLCFLYADDNGKMKRGCKSNRELYQHCLSYGEKRCLTCFDTNGCNSQPLLSKPKLFCSSCDSRSMIDKNSINCAWTQPESSISKCQNSFPYYLQELCVMSYLPEIELSVRGCLYDIGGCEPSSFWCQACDTNGCNVVNLKTQRCFQCSSNHLENCGNNLKELTTETCKAEVQTFETRGCYINWNLDHNITTRGCISDLTAEGIDYCRANTNLCIFCYEDGCNNLLAPSSSARKTAMKFGFIFIGILYML